MRPRQAFSHNPDIERKNFCVVWETKHSSRCWFDFEICVASLKIGWVWKSMNLKKPLGAFGICHVAIYSLCSFKVKFQDYKWSLLCLPVNLKYFFSMYQPYFEHCFKTISCFNDFVSQSFMHSLKTLTSSSMNSVKLRKKCRYTPFQMPIWKGKNLVQSI